MDSWPCMHWPCFLFCFFNSQGCCCGTKSHRIFHGELPAVSYVCVWLCVWRCFWSLLIYFFALLEAFVFRACMRMIIISCTWVLMCVSGTCTFFVIVCNVSSIRSVNLFLWFCRHFYDLKRNHIPCLEHAGDGRVLAFDPHTKGMSFYSVDAYTYFPHYGSAADVCCVHIHTTLHICIHCIFVFLVIYIFLPLGVNEVITGLNFANGIVLSHDQQSLLVIEACSYRIMRVYIHGYERSSQFYFLNMCTNTASDCTHHICNIFMRVVSKKHYEQNTTQ